MKWTEWASLIGAFTGTGLGVYNALLNRRRDLVRLKVSGFTKHGDDGIRRLRIKLVNTGRIAVTVEKVFLSGPRGAKAKSWELWEHNRAYARLPVLLKDGEAVILVTHRDSVYKPLMLECFTVVAKTADGRDIKGRSSGLRELADELKTERALSDAAKEKPQ